MKHENETHDNKEAIGRRIAELRKEKGMTQQELADAIGYSSKSSINMVETGRHSVPSYKLRKLARALGVDVSDILGVVQPDPKGDKKSDETVKIFSHLSEETARMLYSCVSKSTEEDILKTLEIIEVLRKGRNQ